MQLSLQLLLRQEKLQLLDTLDIQIGIVLQNLRIRSLLVVLLLLKKVNLVILRKMFTSWMILIQV